MKTLDEALAFVKTWKGALDGRDKQRFSYFVPFDRLGEADLKPAANMTAETWGDVTDWTEKNVLKQLENDAKFGLEKANDERGISAACMFDTVNMWCHLLENGLDEETYGDYGRAFFTKVLDHYGWNVDVGAPD